MGTREARQTLERQADMRQPGGHEPASLENSKAQIPQNKLGKGQPTGKERPVSFLMLFYLSLETRGQRSCDKSKEPDAE